MSDIKKMPTKILHEGYWIVTHYFTPYGHDSLPARGWSFKVMHADFTDEFGHMYDWEKHEDLGGFYYCAWCNRVYFGESEEAAIEAAKVIIGAQLKIKDENRSGE